MEIQSILYFLFLFLNETELIYEQARDAMGRNIQKQKSTHCVNNGIQEPDGLF